MASVDLEQIDETGDKQLPVFIISSTTISTWLLCRNGDLNPRPSDSTLYFSWSSLLASDLLLSRTVGPQLVASTLGYLGVAAIATVLVTSKQTQSMYIQQSIRPTAWLTSLCYLWYFVSKFLISIFAPDRFNFFRISAKNQKMKIGISNTGDFFSVLIPGCLNKVSVETEKFGSDFSVWKPLESGLKQKTELLTD